MGWGGRRAQEWTAAVLANADLVNEQGQPLCLLRLEGCTTVATTGDHIVPQHDAPELRYDLSNGRPSCVSCNSKRGKRDLSQIRAAVIDQRSFFERLPVGSPAPSFRFLSSGPQKSANRAERSQVTPA